MALCDKPCCNIEARKALRQQREAEFEAYLAAHDRRAVTVALAPSDNDVSYGEAIARAASLSGKA